MAILTPVTENSHLLCSFRSQHLMIHDSKLLIRSLVKFEACNCKIT